MKITKEWLKPHAPCAYGFRWFLEKFPQGAPFGEVYEALRADRRYDDSDWLSQHAFLGLAADKIVGCLVTMAGADKDKIEAQVKADGASDEATATTGYRANAATTGEGANAATTGYRANAATTGEGANAATTGEGAIAASLGRLGKAQAGKDGAIVLAYWDEKAKRPRVKVGYVGENDIQQDVLYQLNDHFEFEAVNQVKEEA